MIVWYQMNPDQKKTIKDEEDRTQEELKMNTQAAQNFLDNTEMKLKVKGAMALALAAMFLVIVFLENVLHIIVPTFETVYQVIGIIALVLSGGVIQVLKFAANVYKWIYLFIPFILVDFVFAASAGLAVLIIGVFLPFIPVAWVTFNLYRERQNAKLYL